MKQFYDVSNIDTTSVSIMAIIKPTNQRYFDKKNKISLTNYIVDYTIIPNIVLDNILNDYENFIEKIGYSLLSNTIDSIKFNIILKQSSEDYKEMLKTELRKSVRFTFKFNSNSIDSNILFQQYDLTDLLNTNFYSDRKDLNSFFPKSFESHVFIFKNIEWTTITLFFRKAGIVLTGGNPSRRTYLSNSKLTLSLVLFSFIRIFNYKGDFYLNEKIAYLNKEGIFNPFYKKFYTAHLESELKFIYNLQVNISEDVLNVNMLKSLFNDSIEKGIISYGFNPYHLIRMLIRTARLYFKKDKSLYKPSNDLLGNILFKYIIEQLRDYDNNINLLMQLLKYINEIKPKDAADIDKLESLSNLGIDAHMFIKEKEDKKYKSIADYRHYFDEELNRIISVDVSNKDNNDTINENNSLNNKNNSDVNNNVDIIEKTSSNNNILDSNFTSECKIKDDIDQSNCFNKKDNPNTINMKSKENLGLNKLKGINKRSYFTSAILRNNSINNSSLNIEENKEVLSISNNVLNNENPNVSDKEFLEIAKHLKNSINKLKLLTKVIQNNKTLSYLDLIEMFLNPPLNNIEAKAIQYIIERGWEHEISQDLNSSNNINIMRNKISPCVTNAYEIFTIM